jgi:archaellin
MTTHASIGIVSIALIATLVALATATGSILVQKQTTTADTYSQLVDDVTTDLTSYLEVRQIIGKFDPTHHYPPRIAINIHPLTTNTIDLNKMTVQITTTSDLFIYNYRESFSLKTGSLFSDDTWNRLATDTYSFTVSNDDDASIQAAHTLNKNTDTGFLLLTLPDTMNLNPYDTFELTIMPTPGQPRVFTLEVPLPSTTMATLYP